MKNYINDSKIPMGLGMALAQNIDAMNYFSSLSEDVRSQIIEHTHTISSKEEMKNYVQSFVRNE